MKLLEIIHPAAKTLVDISLSQDAEVMPVIDDDAQSTPLMRHARCAVIEWPDVCDRKCEQTHSGP